MDIAANGGGAMSVLKSFYNYIKENDHRNQWTFLLSDSYLEETENIQVQCFPEVKKSHFRKLLFDFLYGRKVIGRYDPDIVLSLQNTAVWGLKVPLIDYVHQSLPFQTAKKYSFTKVNERKMAVCQHLIGKIIKMSIRKADRVVVQTQWMKDSVCSTTGKSLDSVMVIYPPYDNKKPDQVGDWDKNYFFYPTGDYIYKNIGCLVEAKKRLPAGLQEKCRIEITLPDGKYMGLHGIGIISHDAVMKKLRESTLVFPSYIETVGLPLMEARTMGSIILASDCAFSREVLDGYKNARFFDPFQPGQLSELMTAVMNGTIRKYSAEDAAPTEPPDCMRGSWENLLNLIEETVQQ